MIANNPHIALHDACQIVIERPSASICFSFEEWNAQGRRVTKGRKGIPYYDNDGSKRFVFDVSDTHGDNRYRRSINPVKKILDGLDLVNGTEIAGSNRGDYRIMLSGVVNYLGQNEFFTEDEDRNRLIAEGVTYLLYSRKGKIDMTAINNLFVRIGLYIDSDRDKLYKTRVEAIRTLRGMTSVKAAMGSSDEIRKEILSLAKDLPKTGRLSYGSKDMEAYVGRVNKW